MKNVEDNKLIDLFMAQFEQHESDRDAIIHGLTVKGYPPQAFHEDWNKLIPVVSECFDNSELADGKDTNVVGDISHHLLDTDIEKTHEAVVRFIKWYNNLSK